MNAAFVVFDLPVFGDRVHWFYTKEHILPLFYKNLLGLPEKYYIFENNLKALMLMPLFERGLYCDHERWQDAGLLKNKTKQFLDIYQYAFHSYFSFPGAWAYTSILADSLTCHTGWHSIF